MSGCGTCGTDVLANATCYAQEYGATIIVPEPNATLKMYAAKVGAATSGKNGWVTCLVAAFLITRRVIYSKKTPGDCGANVRPSIGTTGVVTVGVANAAVADPEPISKSILTGLAAIGGVFTAHHVQAEQTEQATLCDVAAKYNGAAEAIEQYVANGQLDVDSATATLQSMVNGLLSEMAPIRKSCNAACGFGYALNALVLYNHDLVYPVLYNAPASGIQAAPGTPGGTQVIIPTAPLNELLAGSPSAKTLALLAGLGIVFVAITR